MLNIKDLFKAPEERPERMEAVAAWVALSLCVDSWMEEAYWLMAAMEHIRHPLDPFVIEIFTRFHVWGNEAMALMEPMVDFEMTPLLDGILVIVELVQLSAISILPADLAMNLSEARWARRAK
jgi:hypothetical protein